MHIYLLSVMYTEKSAVSAELASDSKDILAKSTVSAAGMEEKARLGRIPTKDLAKQGMAAAASTGQGCRGRRRPPRQKQRSEMGSVHGRRRTRPPRDGGGGGVVGRGPQTLA